MRSTKDSGRGGITWKWENPEKELKEKIDLTKNMHLYKWSNYMHWRIQDLHEWRNKSCLWMGRLDTEDTNFLHISACFFVSMVINSSLGFFLHIIIRMKICSSNASFICLLAIRIFFYESHIHCLISLAWFQPIYKARGLNSLSSYFPSSSYILLTWDVTDGHENKD